MRPLGIMQRGCLDFLIQFKGWHPHCGWTWGTPSASRRVLEGLVARGLAKPKKFKWCQGYVDGYVATAKGKRLDKMLKMAVAK